jgi:hypothetical protein
MVRAAALTLALAAVAACHGHGGPEGTDAILLDDASDEVLVALIDADAQGLVMTSDAESATLTAPADGATVSPASPMTLTWQGPPSSAPGRPRHGIATGQFVWIRLSAPGVDPPIDILALSSTSYTCDADHWQKLLDAGGSVTATITTAYADDAIIQEGPFRPSAATTFTIE